MTVPSVIGFYLCDAKIVLQEVGIHISSIKVTAPPRNASQEFYDTFRVVRQTLTESNEIELLVCKPL